jgi:hypothetical protein
MTLIEMLSDGVLVGTDYCLNFFFCDLSSSTSGRGPLQKAGQARPVQMRDSGLQGVKAIIQRQNRMKAKGYNSCRLILP